MKITKFSLVITVLSNVVEALDQENRNIAQVSTSVGPFKIAADFLSSTVLDENLSVVNSDENLHILEVAGSAETILEVAASAGTFKTLLKGLSLTGLDGPEYLGSPGNFTVFAPSDEAFANLPEGVLDSLIADPAALIVFLAYHVMLSYPGDPPFYASFLALNSGNSGFSVTGIPIYFEVVSGSIILNGVAEITDSDIIASNGIIHAIDTVLFPPNIDDIIAFNLETLGVKTLGDALSVTGLNETLSGPGPFTVFAPIDEAFANLPECVLNSLIADPARLAKILTYHVLPTYLDASELIELSGTSVSTVNGAEISIEAVSGSLFFNGVKANFTDIRANNGIIHVIEGVLFPPPLTEVVTKAGKKSTKKTKVGKCAKKANKSKAGKKGKK